MRLINADALKESLKELKAEGDNRKYVQGLQDAIDGYFPQIIDDEPTIDAEPVRRGRWIMVRKTKLIPTGYMAVAEGHVLTKTGADKPFTMQEANIIPLKAHKVVKIPYCSVCGNYGDDEYDKTPYCSYCGAKMDGDSE